jgi:ABC-type sugar transport system permease subunit
MNNRWFYVFVSPFFLLFAVFGLYPLLFSLYLGFMKWDGLDKPVFVGLENFITLFQDESFFTCMWNTLVLGLMYVPPMLILAFAFALLLNSSLVRFKSLFRATVFLPCVTPMVVVAIVFSLLYGQETGLLNYLIIKGAGWFGVEADPVPWLESEQWSKISIAILLVWRWTGYNMVLMLSGLQGIDKVYHEAAEIDGASWWDRLMHITVPLMRPIFIFCLITSLIGTLYMFDEVFVLTEGGPGISSMNFGVYLFHQAFTDFRFGYASAAAYVVSAFAFIVSLILLKSKKGEAV